MTTPTVEDVLADHWPLHGPYSGDRTRRAAVMLSHLSRYLNHATRNAESVPYASTAADVLGGVAATARALPQLTEQLADRVAAFAASPHAYVYTGTRSTSRADVDGTVDELRDQLDAVATIAESLGRALDTAQSLANRIGVDEPEEQTGAPLTAARVREALTRAGVDYSGLTITNRPAVWRETDAGPSSVHISGPRPIRRVVCDVLFDLGLSVAPYSDHDEWSGMEQQP